MTRVSAIPLALLASFWAAVALGTGSYQQSVERAQHLLAGSPGKRAVAAALAEIRDGTQCSQPEIQQDLQKPADVADARARLGALDRALTAPAAGSDRTTAALRNQALSAQFRNQQVEAPGDLVTGRIQSWVAALTRGCGGWWPLIFRVVTVIVAAAVLIVIGLLVYRAVRGPRLGRDAAEEAEARRHRTAQERFAAADRLAAAGDFAAAVRELAGAVATALAGETAWEVSPLTVREIFASRGSLRELRPLLRPFEESVYGHRRVDRETYDEAAAAAAPFRSEGRRAA